MTRGGIDSTQQDFSKHQDFSTHQDLPKTADLVVVGAGVVGAAAAWFATLAGLRVVVVDRGAIAGGTSGAGEGNVLVSDKEPGPELELARYSRQVWGEDLGPYGERWEFERKGGLVVASTPAALGALRTLAERQRARGVVVREVSGAELPALEPRLTREAAGGALYPQDAQVQPMLAAAHLLRLARQRGAVVRTGTEVVGFLGPGGRTGSPATSRGGRTGAPAPAGRADAGAPGGRDAGAPGGRDAGAPVTGVRTPHGTVSAPAVLNAAGTWAGAVAGLAGVELPVLPRRGFVLVTEPLPPATVRHKVYAADYVDAVASSDAELQASPVVEGTGGGTVLIGSTRERVGFDRRPSPAAVRALARGAIGLFPMLASVRAMRVYAGFRPYCPDHLPVIGPDPRAPGLWHACGHEGAGIGLAAGTGKLIAQALTGEATDLDLTPFAPERFEEGGADESRGE
ncbi:NAD(P)/FAD-dependent oxidoreductase [Streptomyces rugosispiralis]|uniref:FAD-binding oxidoreductase n=1 Tax=Streptomyces rugosispiralis TaxID=2967341 RepID=A0ABT1V5R5_9ACTN|nr:FAD-dependent oxidoreductase [Streptomyces rugosispiralis]MCQ8192723.1 FAD-binding oxidoreductase [Streptomyces rugosispiralis]